LPHAEREVYDGGSPVAWRHETGQRLLSALASGFTSTGRAGQTDLSLWADCARFAGGDAGVSREHGWKGEPAVGTMPTWGVVPPRWACWHWPAAWSRSC